jgi:hypothetical protein
MARQFYPFWSFNRLFLICALRVLRYESLQIFYLHLKFCRSAENWVSCSITHSFSCLLASFLCINDHVSCELSTDLMYTNLLHTIMCHWYPSMVCVNWRLKISVFFSFVKLLYFSIDNAHLTEWHQGTPKWAKSIG